MPHEMPRPGEHHARLGALAGDWVGEETMHPSPWDPKGGTALARARARMDLDGFALIMDYTQERDGQVRYRGHGVFGYDAKDGAYLMHWFDSMGDLATNGPVRGRWEGDVLAFEHRTPMGWTRYVYTFESDGRYRMALDHSPDGRSWKPFVEGIFRRA